MFTFTVLKLVFSLFLYKLFSVNFKQIILAFFEGKVQCVL